MLETLARLGYASKAAVYAIVGVLAILTALNRGGRVTDTSGALRVVMGQPFGQVLLGVLALGLCGYAVWRLLDSFVDPDRDGTSAGGLITRVGNAIRGCIYGALGLEAFRLLRGLSGSKGNETRRYTALVLDLPLGELLLGIIGAIVALYGLSQLVDSIRGKGDAKVDMSCLSSDWRHPLATISRFGVGVRGGLIATLGFFLLRAAWTHDPSEAADQRESMLQLGGLVEGRWFLAIIAAGVLAYAVDQAVHARCRRIRSPV
ncbi:MAG TPA: DUF1206 domain-containing protein [Vicinamibacterales bacterium]|nr:DUF1206 domain-containing protein [Vicinamibacterales bacterium]